MGIRDFLRRNISTFDLSKKTNNTSTLEEEKGYYRPDEYYTDVTFEGSFFEKKVITFEERKRSSNKSKRGLYVGEILLLRYVAYGNYPKPSSGYPGFWWFEYGIRDIGQLLQSLESRGFIEYASGHESLERLKVTELKKILSDHGLPNAGKKADLIDSVKSHIDESELDNLQSRKYRLTGKGRAELLDNAYIPYMHQNRHRTYQEGNLGETFTVWDINKLLRGDVSDWKNVVGNIEERLFGVNSAVDFDESTLIQKERSKRQTKKVDDSKTTEMRLFLQSKESDIKEMSATSGDGFEEESKGIDYRKIGKDKEALFNFYVSIKKGFDAPALYRETCALLRKYNLLQEELEVCELGLMNIPEGNMFRDDLQKRKEKIQCALESD
ncbi:MAG: SAP domain-containing protein [Bacillota bacterium]|nr:SAP domain-containing protein [Bacillota bacterium]